MKPKLVPAPYGTFLEWCKEAGHHEWLMLICKEHGITLKDVFGGGRTNSVCLARRKIFFHLVKQYGWSYAETAKRFDTDHTVVRAGVLKEEDRLRSPASPA